LPSVSVRVKKAFSYFGVCEIMEPEIARIWKRCKGFWIFDIFYEFCYFVAICVELTVEVLFDESCNYGGRKGSAAMNGGGIVALVKFTVAMPVLWKDSLHNMATVKFHDTATRPFSFLLAKLLEELFWRGR
jgi:hypothetical protein